MPSRFLALLLLVVSSIASAQAPLVAPTGPRTPDEERKGVQAPARVRGPARRQRAGHPEADADGLRRQGPALGHDVAPLPVRRRRPARATTSSSSSSDFGPRRQGEEGARLRRRPEHPHRRPAAAGLQVVLVSSIDPAARAKSPPDAGSGSSPTPTATARPTSGEMLLRPVRHPRHARHDQLVHAHARRLGLRLPRLPQRLEGEGQGRARSRR